MEKKIVFKERQIETEPLSREILVHSAMLYECEVCRKVYQFWLEKGLEDRKQDAIEPKKHKPVPFCTACLCGGTTKHIAWGSDIHLDDYRPLKDDENYFENTETEDCGISHYRNSGMEVVRKPLFPEFENLAETLKKSAEETKRELPLISEDVEDDPYRLAQFSTTQLKAELRRRKGNRENKRYF